MSALANSLTARDQVGLRVLFESLGALLDRDGVTYSGAVDVRIEVKDGEIATAVVRFANEEGGS